MKEDPHEMTEHTFPLPPHHVRTVPNAFNVQRADTTEFVMTVTPLVARVFTSPTASTAPACPAFPRCSRPGNAYGNAYGGRKIEERKKERREEEGKVKGHGTIEVNSYYKTKSDVLTN